jgi:hypothetical protein
MRAVLACAFACALLCATGAAAVRWESVPQNAQTAAMRAYLHAVQARKWGDAFALLTTDGRAYYRSPQNLASVYAADGFALLSFVFLGTRGDDRTGRVYEIRERASFLDHAHDLRETLAATTAIAVLAERGVWRIKDPGHPWRATTPNATATRDGLRVTVKKISYFSRRIEIVATFANLGDRFVTLLPYGRSALRDESGAVYRPLVTTDWTRTDKMLFEGVRLAPQAQYTGALTFSTPPLGARIPHFSLTLAPEIRDGADVPFSVDVDIPRGS